MLPVTPLMLGNAGTATRFLTAAVALVKGNVVVDGDCAQCASVPSPRWLQRCVRPGIDAKAHDRLPAGDNQQPAARLAKVGLRIDGGFSSAGLVETVDGGARTVSGPIDVALTGKKRDARGYVDLCSSQLWQRSEPASHRSITFTWESDPGRYRATDFAAEPDASASTHLWAAEALCLGERQTSVPDGRSSTRPDAAAANNQVCSRHAGSQWNAR